MTFSGRLRDIKILKILITSLILTTTFILIDFLNAQDDGKERGRTGAKFLEFSPSARATGMGEAFVAVSDLSGITLNPAGLAFLKHKEVSVTYANIYDDKSNQQSFLTGVLPIKEKYAIGADILIFNIPSEPVYNWVGEATGEEITYQGSAVGIAGAMILADRISVGANLKNVSEKICGESVNAFSSDVGGLLQIPVSKGVLQFGTSFCNLGAKFREDQDMPKVLRLGAAYLQGPLTLAGEFANNGPDSINNLKLGGEYWIKDVFAPRFGMKSDISETSHFTGGFGVKWKSFLLDYAFITHQALGISHRVAFGLRFGEPSKEKVKRVKKPKAREEVKEERAPVKRKPGKTVNIAVADLAGKNVSAMDAAIVSDFLRTELVKTRVFTVLDRQNMERILGEQKFQMSGCTSDECAVRMGKILNVQGIVVGTFSKFLGTYYINVSFVDVETGEIIAAEAVECSSGKELPNAAKDVADRLASEF